MKGLDTNVLVRLLVEDDPKQTDQAMAFVRRECTLETQCRINRIVLCELEWVLQCSYGFSRAEVAAVVEKLLYTLEFRLEDSDQVWDALRTYRAGSVELADCLMARTNAAHGCDVTVTFDRKAARTPGFELLAT